MSHFAFFKVFLAQITSFLASSLILPISSSCLRTCALIFSTSRETTEEEEGRNSCAGSTSLLLLSAASSSPDLFSSRISDRRVSTSSW